VEMKYTAELEKALTDAVIPVDQQEQAAALA
jgi:glycerol-3-phosphate dehydrogenase